jgi:hypothetical protein
MSGRGGEADFQFLHDAFARNSLLSVKLALPPLLADGSRGELQDMQDVGLLNQVMDNGLRDWFIRQNAARVRAVEFRKTGQAATLGLGAAGFAVLQSWDAFNDATSLGLALLVAVGFGWAGRPAAALKKNLTTKANEEIARVLGLKYEFAARPSPDFKLAQSLGLLPQKSSKESFSDAWFGGANHTGLHLHEAHLQKRNYLTKRRSLETSFHGMIMGYPHARAFSGTTIVTRDKKVVGLGTPSDIALQPVRLVDPRFEDVFEVHGTDQVEARYLVHPAFCERLLDVEKSFQGINLRMAFSGGRVVVVVETINMFETGTMNPIRDEARVAKTLGQIQSLLTLSQTLNERVRG